MTTGQSLPCNLEDKIRNFVAFNKKQIDLDSLQPAMIANMDKTPIWADMPSATTVDSIGVHAVSIKTTRHEKATHCLSCSKSGWDKNETICGNSSCKSQERACIYPWGCGGSNVKWLDE